MWRSKAVPQSLANTNLENGSRPEGNPHVTQSVYQPFTED